MARLSDPLHEKLAKVGLVAPRVEAAPLTLKSMLDEFYLVLDVKDSTLARIEQASADPLQHFTESRSVTTIVDHLFLLIDARFHLKTGFEFFQKVVGDAARQHRRHPVREYLAHLTWDGTPRLDQWLVTYAGAADSPYIRAVGALVLVAAVRRAREPGCKFDEMLVLEGKQGDDKSTLLRRLAVNDDWFSDHLPFNADVPRQIEALSGHWIVEAAELTGMRKADVEGLKAFLSRQIDKARMAYGRRTKVSPRQCVIIGTTNAQKYLKDSTGNRRFWPVRCSRIDASAMERDRDQLWAEAAAREADGAVIRLDPGLYGAAAQAQEERVVNSPIYETLERALTGPDGKVRTGKVRSEDLWKAIGRPDRKDRRQDDMYAVSEGMHRLGFESTKLRFGNDKPEYGYARGTAAERLERIRISEPFEIPEV